MLHPRCWFGNRALETVDPAPRGSRGRYYRRGAQGWALCGATTEPESCPVPGTCRRLINAT